MLSLADYVILAVVGASSLLSLLRGFVKEAVSLAAWVLAFAVTGHFYDRLAVRLTYFNDAMVRIAVASALLFTLTLIVAGLCGNILRALITKAGLSGTDRLLGVVFGVLRGVLVVCAVLALLQILFKFHILTFIADEPWWKDSLFIPELTRIVSWFFVYVGTPSIGV